MKSRKPKNENKNLQIVAKFTVFSYSYVRQVACGHRENPLITSAINAVNNNDWDALVAIQSQREEEIRTQDLKMLLQTPIL